jgi:regulator of protease activity HflC (stomatin/prohibitin superfamily)
MSWFHRKITVPAGERAVEYVRGTSVRVLGPGRHSRPFRATYRKVSTREQLVTIAPQEVLTADGLSVRASAALRWAVADPRAFLELAQEPIAPVYLAIQVALRDALAEVTVLDAVRHLRESVSGRLVEAARAAAGQVGVEVRGVVVKDVLLPLEVRAAQAELVTARTRGQAQLEKARAETAALRSLANAARMLDDHPALAQLRLVQALPAGATVKLAVEHRDDRA